MRKFVLSEINIYPVKSLGGISLQNSIIESRGLRYDRRWMLIDENNRFMTQREFPEMALINAKIVDDELKLRHKIYNYDELVIPFHEQNSDQIEVSIWEGKVTANHVSNSADCWLSKVLRRSCRLVHFPDSSIRKVDPEYSVNNDNIGFADGYPFLIIGQSSLGELNRRLTKPVSMNRFRPNLVFSGGEPFEEDEWKKFKIGSTIFYSVKPCARCSITTVDQTTGEKHLEPLQTLASFRKSGNKVLFGQNLLHEGNGRISVGQTIEVLEGK